MNKTLLLIDADADCEELMSQAASHTDYTVLLAKTSREAFEILEEKLGRLDLIVVDVDPGAHSLALLEAISACADHPPIIVVTALEEIYMSPIAAEHGAVRCLGKPLGLPRLLSAFHDVPGHQNLTCDRWGSLIPAPLKKLADTTANFRGIARKLRAPKLGNTRRS